MAAPDPDCPFCADRAAFAAYRSAGGTVALIEYTGESVSVHEIHMGRAAFEDH